MCTCALSRSRKTSRLSNDFFVLCAFRSWDDHRWDGLRLPCERAFGLECAKLVLEITGFEIRGPAFSGRGRNTHDRYVCQIELPRHVTNSQLYPGLSVLSRLVKAQLLWDVSFMSTRILKNYRPRAHRSSCSILTSAHETSTPQNTLHNKDGFIPCLLCHLVLLCLILALSEVCRPGMRSRLRSFVRLCGLLLGEATST